MTTITTEMYYRGRDRLYPQDLTPTIKANVARTLVAVNALVAALERDKVGIECHPVTKTPVSSGWRPPAINAATPNAAVRSKHMTGEAIDLFDPDGAIDDWCLKNRKRLKAEFGLYLEHPSATKGWCHVQIAPPRSGNTVFYP